MAARFDRPETPRQGPTLFDPPPLARMPTLAPAGPDREHRPPESIQEAFERFCDENPWVEIEMRRMALELVAMGHRKVGVAMLWESLRWRVMRGTTDSSSPFRLNNNYRSRMARRLMETTPELEDVFDLRALHTA